MHRSSHAHAESSAAPSTKDSGLRLLLLPDRSGDILHLHVSESDMWCLHFDSNVPLGLTEA